MARDAAILYHIHELILSINMMTSYTFKVLGHLLQVMLQFFQITLLGIIFHPA